MYHIYCSPVEKRNFNCYSFVEFYLLESIEYHLLNDRMLVPSERHFLPSVQYAVRKLEEYKSEFEEAFALRLRDYLWFAAIGEARHSNRVIGSYIEEMSHIQNDSRGYAYDEARKFPPTENNVSILHSLFNDYCWDGSYGGDGWASIVDAVRLYNELTPSAFIDHCADLQHNGGVAFDKGVSFWDTKGYSKLLNFLNFKFHADSLVFELPTLWDIDTIRSVLSRKVLYLMNKLFALTGQSPFWKDTFRYTGGIQWVMDKKDVYSSHNEEFSAIYEATCYNCGKKLSQAYEVNHDDWGNAYCEECSYYCDYCGEYHTGEPYHKDEYGNPVCEGCFDYYFYTCEMCGEVFHEHDMVDDLCEECAKLATCDVCEKVSENNMEVIDLDNYTSMAVSYSWNLQDSAEYFCPDCLKKFLDAGYRIFRSNVGLVMSKDIDAVMQYPYGELLKIELGLEFTYASTLIAKGVKLQGMV